MEGQTLSHALEKLNNMDLNIGYPDELLNATKIYNHYKLVNIKKFYLNFILEVSIKFLKINIRI
jgi:predicted metalloendopeptidase